MIHRFITLSIVLVLLVGHVLAGQVCTIDPARAATAIGAGFYVARPSAQRAASSADTSLRLFDPTGAEFRIRGVNSNHWDAWGASAGLPRSGANTVRLFLRFTDPPATSWSYVAPLLAAGITPIPTNWTTTCKADQASLAAAVDSWVTQAATWRQLNAAGLINIANEWGSTISMDGGVGWRDGNLAAIARTRGAGLTMPLVIDAGGCGQDAGTVVRWGQTLLDADPEHNLLFSVHVYGSWHYPATATWMQDYATAMAQLRATGLPVLVGEFGPFQSGNASSKTLVPTDKLIGDLEANGWGWLAWSWTDNNLPNCMSDDNGFGMTVRCGTYTGNDAAELTAWGRTIVPYLKATAARAQLVR